MCCDLNTETEVAGWSPVLVLPADFSAPCLFTVYHSNGFENSFKMPFFHLIGPAVCWSSGRKKGSASPLWWRSNSFEITVCKDGLRLVGIAAVWTFCSQWCLVFRWMLCVQLSLAVTGWEQTGWGWLQLSLQLARCLASSYWKSAYGWRYGWRGGIKNNQKVDSGLGYSVTGLFLFWGEDNSHWAHYTMTLP